MATYSTRVRCNHVTTLSRWPRTLFLLPAIFVFALAVPCQAQETYSEEYISDDEEVSDEIFVTATRITNPNVISASPVMTIDMEEIGLQQTPNIERVFRGMPITIPGDGENVNNASRGQATINLRALGPGRSLILIDGKRLAPYNFNGVVSTDIILVNMLERVDGVTGGASAVYGSDAMSGAINFILRDDFEGFELELGYSDTDSDQAVNGGGEDTSYVNALFGVRSDDGRGHIVVGGGYTDRGAIRA